MTSKMLTNAYFQMDPTRLKVTNWRDIIVTECACVWYFTENNLWRQLTVLKSTIVTAESRFIRDSWEYNYSWQLRIIYLWQLRVNLFVTAESRFICDSWEYNYSWHCVSQINAGTAGQWLSENLPTLLHSTLTVVSAWCNWKLYSTFNFHTEIPFCSNWQLVYRGCKK